MNTDHWKQQLEKERERLLQEIKKVGKRDPARMDDWVPDIENTDIDSADEMEVAEKLDEFGEAVVIEEEIEEELHRVEDALSRIEKGTYGVCSICGKAIEDARLEANPSAETCIAHRDQGRN